MSLSPSRQVRAADLFVAAGMEPDPWQHEAFTRQGHQLWLWHRQSGKSTCVAAVALEEACAADNQLVLLVSRSLRQSGELFRKVVQFYDVTRPVALLRRTQLSLELANRSRIVSLPATEETIVGYSAVRLVILDEAARIPDSVYYALRPMLVRSRGRLIALSTPWGKRGWFWEAWQGHRETPEQRLDRETVEQLLADLGITVAEEQAVEAPQEPWQRSLLTVRQNPRISPYFLAAERMQVPDLVFQQEWVCAFVDNESSVFRYEDIQAMLTQEIEPLFVPQRNWRAVNPGGVVVGISGGITPLFGE